MLLDLSAKFDLVPLAQVVRPLHAVAMPLGAEFFLMGPLRATLCCCTRMAWPAVGAVSGCATGWKA